jgi:hypothetical protein
VIDATEAIDAMEAIEAIEAIEAKDANAAVAPASRPWRTRGKDLTGSDLISQSP